MNAPPTSLHTGFVFDRAVPTRYPGLYVWKQDRNTWRHVATDDLGDSDVTGPPFATKDEALAELPATARSWGLDENPA